MTQALTNTGLNLPEDVTEEEFFEAGRFLARVEHGMQWAIGDWYNQIKWKDKKAACEKAGLNHKTAQEYGRVAAAIKMEVRTSISSFRHGKILAFDKLTDAQRSDLLEKSSKNGWSVKQLTVERDSVLGRVPPPAPPKIQRDIDKALAELPKSVPQKAKKQVKRIYSTLVTDFRKEVLKEATIKTEELRQTLLTQEKEAQETKETYKKLITPLTGFMTKEEFRLVRSCLHPDKAPTDRREQFTRAFHIFNRLESTINPNMHKAAKEKAGW